MTHTSFTVSDLERALGFYCDLLGMEVRGRLHRQAPWIAEVTGFEGADLQIALVAFPGADHVLELIEYVAPKGEGPRRVPTNDVGAAHVAFTVDDIDAEYARLRDAGVQFTSPPVEITESPGAGKRAAYFRDPDGIPLELVWQPADIPPEARS